MPDFQCPDGLLNHEKAHEQMALDMSEFLSFASIAPDELTAEARQLAADFLGTGFAAVFTAEAPGLDRLRQHIRWHLTGGAPEPLADVLASVETDELERALELLRLLAPHVTARPLEELRRNVCGVIHTELGRRACIAEAEIAHWTRHFSDGPGA